MWNSTHTHKRIISAFVKTLQIKLLLLSAAKQFTLATLGNEVSTAIKCSEWLPEN